MNIVAVSVAAAAASSSPPDRLDEGKGNRFSTGLFRTVRVIK